MKNLLVRKTLLAFVLAGAVFAAGCSSNPDGNYKDAEGAVTLELKGGKANLNFGGIHIDGAYTVDGNKITLRPTQGDASQTMVFTINSDGSLAGPPGSEMPHLDKAK